jgi:transcription-repair coupling factor (superfamily II helicase)
MILPVVRERFEALLRQPALEGVVSALQGGAKAAGCVGLTELAKAIAVAYITSQLRRPAFLVVDSNKKAERLRRRCGSASVFPERSWSPVAVLPAFDTFPWESRAPHADILERRAATLYRLAAGETSLVIAPMASVLWRYRDGSDYAGLTRELEKDKEVPLQDFLAHLGATGYARTEMVELPGQFAVRGGIVDIFSPEAARPVRVELLGDTVESVREFDPRTQRSIAPVNRTTVLPLTEWAVAQGDGAEAWALPTYWGPASVAATKSLFELTPSSLEPVIYVDEPSTLRPAVDAVLAEATEAYKDHRLRQGRLLAGEESELALQLTRWSWNS